MYFTLGSFKKFFNFTQLFVCQLINFQTMRLHYLQTLLRPNPIITLATFFHDKLAAPELIYTLGC